MAIEEHQRISISILQRKIDYLKHWSKNIGGKDVHRSIYNGTARLWNLFTWDAQHYEKWKEREKRKEKKSKLAQLQVEPAQ